MSDASCPSPAADRVAIVADASEYGRAAVREILRRSGFRTILEAGNGAEAVALIQGGAPDLVVLDWRLDIIPAPEIVRHARTGPEGEARRCPAVILMDETSRSQIDGALAAGADAIVARPFSARSLGARLDFAWTKDGATA